MKNQIRRVFVSHIHEDDNQLKDLKDLVEKHGMELKDSSIRSDKPNRATSEDYIKTGILAPAIQYAGTLVVYITQDTRDSKWVDWEIRHAQRIGKRIVGVLGHGAAKCDLPDAFEEYGDALVGWNGRRIVDAIRGKINDWEPPAGAHPEKRAIKRYTCGGR